MVQITIIRMSGFDAWIKNSVGCDREHHLQNVLHGFYTKVQNLFSKMGSLVFPNTLNELFAITNGMTIKDHKQVYKELNEFFPFDIEMLIGSNRVPLIANEHASLAKENNQFVHERIFGKTTNDHTELVSLLYLNYENDMSYSKKFQYEKSLDIQKIYFKMSQFFLQRNAIAFYMGSNSFIVLDSENISINTRDFVKYANDVLGISVNCGIGIAKTARIASTLATASLDLIHENFGKYTESKIVQMKYLNGLDQDPLVFEVM